MALVFEAVKKFKYASLDIDIFFNLKRAALEGHQEAEEWLEKLKEENK